MTIALTSTTIAAISPNRAVFSIRRGEKQSGWTNTFPARRYWLRRDQVLANGVTLEGHIETRGNETGKYGQTFETFTMFRYRKVHGAQLDWLLTENREAKSCLR